MTEQWKPIPGYEAIYDASDHGRIRSYYGRDGRTRGRVLCDTPQSIVGPRVGPGGYCLVNLYQNGTKRTHSLHVLVLSAFQEKPSTGHVVNHRNGNPLDNRLENLEWLTRSENLLHAFRVLGRNRGGNQSGRPINQAEANGTHKLTAEQVRYIRNCYVPGRVNHLAIIARRYGVGYTAVWNLVHGKSWKSIK